MTGPEVPTVLVVDDDDSIREITRLALEAVAGWRAIPAAGGEEAIGLAREHHPDAILLDYMMPVLDGRATFQALQADESTRGIPVILLTAKLQVGGRQVWDDLAIAGVIPKPFSPTTLAAEVAAMLGWQAADT